MSEDTAPLGRSRAGVLDMLLAADAPLGVREVAQQMGLHPNTARFHLEALVDAGLAVREAEERDTPGRPRIGYLAVAEGPAGQRRYRLLAEMLTSLIAGTMPDPVAAAEEAGREWGAYLTEQPQPYQRLTAAEAIERLTAIMDGTRLRAARGDLHWGRRVSAVPAPVPVPRGGPEAPRRYLHAASRADARRTGPDARAGHRRRPGTVRGTQLVHRPPGGTRGVWRARAGSSRKLMARRHRPARRSPAASRPGWERD